jgi:hypothetical protein
MLLMGEEHNCEKAPKDLWIEYDDYRKCWEISDGSHEYGISGFYYCPWCGVKLNNPDSPI